MSEAHLLETADNGVVALTMNRPGSLNALSGEMMGLLREAVPRLAADKSVRVVVLTGAGKAFCAGGDVKGMAQRNAGAAESLEERASSLRTGMEVSRQIYEMPKLTIARMRGAAAGAGLSLALACDLRIASDNARFTTAFAKVGFSGDYGGTYFMTQLVGTAKARELYYLSERVSAEEALRLGLTNWICEPEELMEKTMEIANRLAKGPTVAYRYMKENLNRALAGDVDDCMDLEATHHVHCGQTQDHREAVKAFVEKKEPVFVGR